MISKCFKLSELVCPYVFNKYGDFAWNVFDPRLIETIDSIRLKSGLEMYINNWLNKGQFSQRGFRCMGCQLVQNDFNDNVVSIEPHRLGKAIDFDMKGNTAEQTRLLIAKYPEWLPYSIRLETGVSWVHLDLMNNTDQKITYFHK